MDSQQFTDSWLFPELEQQQDAQAIESDAIAQESQVNSEHSRSLDNVHSDEIDHQDISIVADRLNDSQLAFIDADEWWKVEWQDMPEYIPEDAPPWKTLPVHFRSAQDLREFCDLTGLSVKEGSRSTWFPAKEIDRKSERAYVDES